MYATLNLKVSLKITKLQSSLQNDIPICWPNSLIFENERKLPEGHHRIDMTVDLHTAVIVMLFAVSMIVSKIVPLSLSFTPFFTP